MLTTVPHTQMLQIMTFHETLVVEADETIVANAAAHRMAVLTRNALGISYKEYCKCERKRKDAEEFSETEAEAAVKTQKAKPTATESQAAGTKHKISVTGFAEAEVVAPTEAPPFAANTSAHTTERGHAMVKKTRFE